MREETSYKFIHPDGEELTENEKRWINFLIDAGYDPTDPALEGVPIEYLVPDVRNIAKLRSRQGES
jgi:hypothetical protein